MEVRRSKTNVLTTVPRNQLVVSIYLQCAHAWQHVNKGSVKQFYLPSAYLSTNVTSHPGFTLRSAEHHRTLVGNHFPSCFATGRIVKCSNERVSMSVCPFAYLKTTRPNVTRFPVQSDSNAPWFMCWFWRFINCLFVCLLSFLPHFLHSLLASFLMLFFSLIYFLTCLLPDLFIYSFPNRPIPFPGRRS